MARTKGASIANPVKTSLVKHYRGRFVRSRFDLTCLGEYAEIFKTVCVDAAYYSFPGRENLRALAAQVPAAFRFGFKVTDVRAIDQAFAEPVSRTKDVAAFGEVRLAAVLTTSWLFT